MIIRCYNIQINESTLLFLAFNLIFFWYQPKPRFDYTLKAVGGSLTAVPGLSDMIEVSFLYNQIATFFN